MNILLQEINTVNAGVKNSEMSKILQLPGPCQRDEKVVEHKDDYYTNYSRCTRNGHQRSLKKTGGTGRNRYHLGDSTVKIYLYT